ncbi:MAG: type I restriction enzyme HsdR N-terminal domain-containing protein [Fimbriimonadaceae bacterium]|nr:type I restriction enzyme HsdR N-terminal domain-containing protein [Fimbriimonadaceae bacterium]
MRQELLSAVAAALAASKPPPTNEQETCFRIIDPLLRAMGYGFQEIKIQDRDHAGQKPDYTILPDAKSQTWFLEAKAWDVGLDDRHAIQAVNYANTQGMRWVVLSNGREWRLYDNHILGTVDAKLACRAHLDGELAASFLEALSKSSVEQGKLEDFVRNQRLYSVLLSQLERPDSEVTKAIVRVLRSVSGLANVNATHVVAFWRDYASPTSSRIPVSNVEARQLSEKLDDQSRDLPSTPAQQSEAIRLGQVDKSDITHRKIKAIILPNGNTVPTTKWNQLSILAATYALDFGNLELPVFSSQWAKSPLLAVVDSEISTKMREPHRLSAPHSNILVELHFSANGHQRSAVRIMEAAGLDPKTFRFIMEDRPQ